MHRSALAVLFFVALAPPARAFAPEPRMEFSAFSECLDYSSTFVQCVSCVASYDTNGKCMAEAAVAVSQQVLPDGSLTSCAGLSGSGITAAAGITSTVRAVGTGPGPFSLVVVANVHLNYPLLGCTGFARAGIENYDGLYLDHPGGLSKSVHFEVGGGVPISISAGGMVSCGGCRESPSWDPSNPSSVRFIDCNHEGDVVADPYVVVDPDSPNADSVRMEYFDAALNDWVEQPPVMMDHDNDGVFQPEDCDDFHADAFPGGEEVPDDGIDQDCSGGDAHPDAAEDGAECAIDEECASGVCVDGMCCDVRCGDGGEDTCSSCRASDTGLADGTCAAFSAGTMCREAIDACDFAETCDGTRLECPGDFHHQIGEVCRAAVNACDAPETCIGAGDPSRSYRAVCPDDVGMPGSTEVCDDVDNDCNGQVDEAPVCVPDGVSDTYAAAMSRQLVVLAPGVLGNDTARGSHVLNATVGVTPAHGSLALAADGGFVYTPSDCFYGADQFTYTPVDATTSQAGPLTTVMLTVPKRAASFDLDSVTSAVAEGGSATTLGVRRGGDCAGTVKVTCYTQANTAAAADFEAVSSVLTFAPNVTSQSCTVRALDDATVEGFESFYLRLKSQSTGTTLGLQRNAVITIEDDDGAGTFDFAAVTNEVDEGAGEVAIDVVRRDATAGVSATVKWAVAAGSAGAADYALYDGETRLLTFGAGQTRQTIHIRILEDALVEGGESFRVALTSPSGGARLGDGRNAVVQISDNDGAPSPFVFSTPVMFVAESAGSVTLHLLRLTATNAATVTVKATASIATSPADFTANAGTVVSFDAGQNTAEIIVPINDDSLVEGIETFNVVLTSPSGGALGALQRAVVVIVDDD